MLDAKLLAYVYLKMTVGQNDFSNLTTESVPKSSDYMVEVDNFKIIEPTNEERKLNLNYFDKN